MSDSETVERESYDPQTIQERWLPVWDEIDPHRAGGADDPRPRKYVLDMFPYPSGDLHMGHAEAWAIGDAVARFWALRGFNVMHPAGWDSFGLPAENAAIKNDQNPAVWTYANINTQAESFRRYGISFDWSRRLHTSDPDYYRWTQWLFLRFFEKGLAYRKASPVNWCPQDQTVLANEQVVAGKCERCGADVTKRDLTQWYFRITDYADRLLDDMTQLEAGWPERVLLMQRNWIGRSIGAEVDFAIEGREEPVTVFTTRPDTLYGATFFVVAADAALAAELCAGEQRAAFEAYLADTRKATEIERMSTDRPKTGVFLGRHAINPVNGELLPIYASDYVLADYGTGAIMAVPAHDQRDLDFARAFDLPVRVVVSNADSDSVSEGVAAPGDGVLVNSGPYDGLGKAEAIERITADLEAKGTGKGSVNYRLRDWLLSRQRFWGCPIPIVHCATCGEVPVPDDDLPVQLPELKGEALKPKGVSPLAAATDWVNTTCPTCGGPATRDADTMDTFVDSSWYFLRYCSPDYEKGPFDVEEVRRWMPVGQYVGGVEHAILHLLYSRFFTKVLHDMGMVDFTEPFLALLNQGQVINQGAAMSKSKPETMVHLGEELARYGVDAVRLTMLFAGPPEDDVDWADVSPTGSMKWLARVWRLAGEIGAAPEIDEVEDPPLRRVTHATVAEVTRLMESHRFNVAIARLMELSNALRKSVDAGHLGAPSTNEAMAALTVMLAPFAPFTAEDCWARLGHAPTVHQQLWPTYDESLATAETITCVIQVNGKVRDRLEVTPDVTEEALRERAMASEAVQRAVGDATIRTVVVRPPKLVNIVL